MNELIERDTTAPAISTETLSFIQMIERASRDPAVDIDKMERLMQMHERMLNRQAETAFNAALSAMQPELPEMPEHGKILNRAGTVQSTYALWEDVNQVIKPVLAKHGFALSFRTGNDGDKIVVTGVLTHAAGHSVTSQFALPLDTSGAKNSVQGLGSSTSYGKRYVAGALLNLTSRGEDNDGNNEVTLSTSAEQKLAVLQEAALEGMAALEAAWSKAGKELRKELAGHLDGLQIAAAKADATAAREKHAA